MPGAGPLNTEALEVPAAALPLHSQRSAARPPRQSLAFGSLGGTSAAEAPLLVIVRSASLQPLRQASWHIGRDAAPPVSGGSPCASRPTALPPLRPRQSVRGTPRCPGHRVGPRRCRSRTATDECGAEPGSRACPTPRDQLPRVAPSEIGAGPFELERRDPCAIGACHLADPHSRAAS